MLKISNSGGGQCIYVSNDTISVSIPEFHKLYHNYTERTDWSSKGSLLMHLLKGNYKD